MTFKLPTPRWTTDAYGMNSLQSRGNPLIVGNHGDGRNFRYMGHPHRIRTYDDELHERRRHLAIVREPIDFEAERLKRLIEKSRDTVDP